MPLRRVLLARWSDGRLRLPRSAPPQDLPVARTVGCPRRRAEECIGCRLAPQDQKRVRRRIGAFQRPSA